MSSSAIAGGQHNPTTNPSIDAEINSSSASNHNGVDRDTEAYKEKWNNPQVNIYRFCAVNLSLMVMGMNDGSIGALIPYIEPYYGISHRKVSTLFIVPLVGYIAAALSNNWIHYFVGQRGVALFGPVCRLAGFIPMSLHPPFPILPVLLLVAGFGNGIQDSAYNAWVGNMQNSNELLGLVHGSYGLGATIGPLVASAMVAKGGLPWYSFYYIISAVVLVELAVGPWSFWAATGAQYRQKLQYNSASDRVTTRQVLREPITWLVALFLLGYTGVEVSLGGWIPTFMLDVRHADPFLAGLTATLFWLGLTLGRVILGFVTGRIGERVAITAYLLLSKALLILYWLVPNIIAAMTSVILLGFFLGPLFPAAIVVATKLLPPEYHVSAIGFAAAIGGGGAAALPFAVGAVAETRGVQVLQPIILGSLIFLLGTWAILPRGAKKLQDVANSERDAQRQPLLAAG